MLKIFFSLWLLFAATLCSATPQQDISLLPEVACHYQMQTSTAGKGHPKPQTADWFFWRSHDTVQTQDTDGDHGEIWQLTANGSVIYRKLYHTDKTAVEYMPADMPTNNMAFDWSKLTQMLSPEELAALQTVKQVRVLGRQAELRKGKVAGQTLEVLWLVNEKLPAKIVRKDQHQQLELKLVKIEVLQDATTKPVSTDVIADYRHIDAADFGDMENDAFVKKIMSVTDHQHHHSL
jgi:hypothetical protein